MARFEACVMAAKILPKYVIRPKPRSDKAEALYTTGPVGFFCDGVVCTVERRVA